MAAYKEPKLFANFSGVGTQDIEQGWKTMEVTVYPGTTGTVEVKYVGSGHFITLYGGMSTSDGIENGGYGGGAAILLTFGANSAGYYKVSY